MKKGHIEITKVLDIDIPMDEQDPYLYTDAITREYLEAHSFTVEEVDISSYVYDEEE